MGRPRITKFGMEVCLDPFYIRTRNDVTSYFQSAVFRHFNCLHYVTFLQNGLTKCHQIWCTPSSPSIPRSRQKVYLNALFNYAWKDVTSYFRSAAIRHFDFWHNVIFLSNGLAKNHQIWRTSLKYPLPHSRQKWRHHLLPFGSSRHFEKLHFAVFTWLVRY